MSAAASSNAIALVDRGFSVEQLKNNRLVIKELLASVLKNGINNDYAAIPGTGEKLTLLKPGAEKICSVFGIAVEPIIETIREGEDVRFLVTCRLTSIASGVYLGCGIGEASTLESKYAWKAALSHEQWESEDPHRRRLHWGKVWENRVQVVRTIEQVRENPNDKMNTVLKMAKKRAMIDAVLTVTAASDTFTQDLENLTEQSAGRASAPVSGARAGAAAGPKATITPEQGKKFFAAWKGADRAVGEVREYLRIHCGGITDDRQMDPKYFAEALRWAGSKEPLPQAKKAEPAAASANHTAPTPPSGTSEPAEMATVRELFGYAGVDFAEQASLLQDFGDKLGELVEYLKARVDQEAASQ